MALWTPAQITTALWLDPQDSGTVTITDSKISQVNDKSGNSRHAGQTDAGRRPILDSGGIYHNLAAAYCYLQWVAFNVRAVFVVSTWVNSSGDYRHIFGSNNSGTDNEWHGSTAAGSLISSSYAAVNVRTGTGRVNGSALAPTSMSRYTSKTLHYFETAGNALLANTGVQIFVATRNFYGHHFEIIALATVPDTETRDKIEGYLAWKHGIVDSLPSDHPYKLAAPTLVAATMTSFLEQIYGDTPYIGIHLNQIYSLLLEVWLTQLYGDVPEILATLAQPYASGPTLNKSLTQPWADALALSAILEQPWTMPGDLSVISEQRYGIAAAVLLKTSEQLYHINANTSLFANLSQPYAIAAEAAMLYYVDTKLFVAGVRTPYLSVEWQDGDEYALSCDITIAGQDIAARCQDGVEIRIDSAGESWFFQCVGGWRLDKRFASEVYHVSGLSRTCALDEGPRLLGDIPSGMASQIVADLAAPYGITVDWQMADGYLPPGKISAADETALAIIGKIVWDAKGKIMSTRAGNLLIVCEEETPVPEWPTVTPAATIVARLERVSTSEQHDKQPGYNRFIVSDQTAAGGNFNLEYQEVDPYTKEVRLFITPIDGRDFYLITSGGAPATIEPFGVTVLQVVDELVEFKEGTGNTQRPIYGISAMAWLRDDLGATVSFTEAGILTAEVAGYSLLKISYVSRYHKWLGRDRNIETVQFVAHEVKTT